MHSKLNERLLSSHVADPLIVKGTVKGISFSPIICTPKLSCVPSMTEYSGSLNWIVTTVPNVQKHNECKLTFIHSMYSSIAMSSSNYQKKHSLE